jgi:hypothetical protein
MTQDEIDEMSFPELIKAMMNACDKVIEGRNDCWTDYFVWVCVVSVSYLGAKMKPPKHIVKLGKEAVMLWKLQQALGKQVATDSKRLLAKGVVRWGWSWIILSPKRTIPWSAKRETIM